MQIYFNLFIALCLCKWVCKLVWPDLLLFKEWMFSCSPSLSLHAFILFFLPLHFISFFFHLCFFKCSYFFLLFFLFTCHASVSSLYSFVSFINSSSHFLSPTSLPPSTCLTPCLHPSLPPSLLTTYTLFSPFLSAYARLIFLRHRLVVCPHQFIHQSSSLHYCIPVTWIFFFSLMQFSFQSFLI